MDYALVAPEKRTFWVFGRVEKIGMVPTRFGPGVEYFVGAQLRDDSLKAVYVAYEGTPEKPGRFLYVGYGSPSRPLWAHGGGARSRCSVFMAFQDDPTFTIEILAIGDNWRGLSFLEDHLFLELKAALNVNRTKPRYPDDARKEAAKFWQTKWLMLFPQYNFLVKPNMSIRC